MAVTSNPGPLGEPPVFNHRATSLTSQLSALTILLVVHVVLNVSVTHPAATDDVTDVTMIQRMQLMMMSQCDDVTV